MDEFKDLDRELEKLRQELNLLDNSVHSPPLRGMDTSDYWRRRLEEEKLLWDKKFAFAEAEKKHLTERLAQQEKQLAEYQQQFQKLQEQMERETQLWQERLRAKETDLMLEKNRLLWEDKIRQANLEIEKYLKEISDLNQKIVHLKDKQEQEKEELLKQFAAEKQNLKEQISLLNQEITLRENAYQDLKNKSQEDARKLSERIEQLSAELENSRSQIQELTEKINKLEESKKEILKQQQDLQKNLQEKQIELKQWLTQQAKIAEELFANFSRLTKKERINYLNSFKQQLTAGPEAKTTLAISLSKRSKNLPYLVTLFGLTIILAIWPKIVLLSKNVWQKLNYQRIYETVYPHPSGIYYDGKDIWVSDWQSQAIYRHHPKNFSLEKIYYLGGGHLNALSGDEKYLYGYDAWEQLIYQFQKDGYLNILKKINLKEIFPKTPVNFSGIAVEANYLWASDIAQGKIYEIDLDQKKVINIYSIPGAVSGLCCDQKKLYLLDGKNYQILEYDRKNWQKQKSYPLPYSYRKNFRPSALTVKGNYCWIVSEKDGRIYRYLLD